MGGAFRSPKRHVHGKSHRRVYVSGDLPTGGVDLRGGPILVAEQFLDRADVMACFQQVRGE